MPRVHHITPADYNKDFGGCLNYLIETIDENDWVALRDIDTLPLDHGEFIKQCQEIADANEFQLVGGITNRLGVAYQLHEEKASDDWNIANHIEIAKERIKKYGSKVELWNKPVAGFFMLFPVWLWDEVGRFPEGGVSYNGKFLDTYFSEKVLLNGYKIGIAKGIYIFHLYRYWADNLRMSTSHLYK